MVRFKVIGVVFWAASTLLFAQTTRKPQPTHLEALVLSEHPKCVVHRELLERIDDGPNSMTVNLISAQLENETTRGLEVLVAAESKHDTVYLDESRVRYFLKIYDAKDFERERLYLMRLCQERGSTGGWDGFYLSMQGDGPDVHLITPGWLLTNMENLGTNIQVDGVPGFRVPLPNTPLTKIVEVLQRGVSQLENQP